MPSSRSYYFIDANGLVAYIMDEGTEFRRAVSGLLEMKNWGDNSIMSSSYVLGETFKRLLTKPDNEYNKDKLETKISKLRELFKADRLVIKRIDDIDFETLKRHMKEIREIDDRIGLGDVFNLAFVCSIDEVITFYTGDSHILESIKIDEYLGKIEPSKSTKGYGD